MDGFTSDCDGGEPSDGSIRSSHSTQQQQQESHQGTPPVISVTHKSPSTLVFVADGKRMAAAMSMPVSRAATQCNAADDDDQEALPPPAWCSTVTVDFTPTSAGCSTLAPLCHDIITMIVADFCDDATARRLMATCRTLRYVCIAMDPVIWRSKCIAAWAGKVRFDPMYWLKDEAPQSLRPLATFPMSPASVRLRRMLDVDSDAAVEPNTPEDVVAFSRLPTEIVTPLLRAAKLMQRGSSAPPEHLARQIATSWRAAYHVSLKDSKRDFLTDEEVLELRWSVEFLRRPEPMPSTEAVFVREGLVKRVQPAPFLPFVPWQLHDSGRKVQVDVYPAHRVRRLDDTWGWNIENAFVRFYSVLRPP